MQPTKREKRCETCRYLGKRVKGAWKCERHEWRWIFDVDYSGCGYWKPKEAEDAVSTTG